MVTQTIFEKLALTSPYLGSTGMSTSTSTTPNEVSVLPRSYCSPTSGAIQIGLLTNTANSIFQTIQET